MARRCWREDKLEYQRDQCFVVRLVMELLNDLWIHFVCFSLFWVESSAYRWIQRGFDLSWVWVQIHSGIPRFPWQVQSLRISSISLKQGLNRCVLVGSNYSLLIWFQRRVEHLVMRRYHQGLRQRSGRIVFWYYLRLNIFEFSWDWLRKTQVDLCHRCILWCLLSLSSVFYAIHDMILQWIYWTSLESEKVTKISQ